MNSTNVDSLAVLSSACFSVPIPSLRRAMARMSAPSAPMAPPSVGVATPRKMVPSTRKINTSGGIRTKVTWRARRDNRPTFMALSRSASISATIAPMVMDRISTSSPGEGFGRSSQLRIKPSCTCDHPKATPVLKVISTRRDL